MTTNKTQAERFWEKVNTSEKDECWTWSGVKNKYGYGLFRFNEKSRLAHRVSYLINVGEIPDGLCVLHKCDNPSCVNPDHLFLGTHDDNMKDAAQKGRLNNRVHYSKLKLDEILEIIRLYDTGKFTRKYLGKMFRVETNYIWEIVCGEHWKKCRTKELFG